MEVTEILQHINRLKGDLTRNATPDKIASACAGLSIYADMLNDKIYDEEQLYKFSRADKYANLVEQGKSPNAAEIELNQDKELIEGKIKVERYKSMIKRLDIVISAHQSYMRTLDSMGKNNL